MIPDLFDRITPAQAPFVLALGCLLVLASATWGYLGWRTTRWPRVSGELLDARRVAGARGTTLRVRYRYVVGGREYVGERQAIGGAAPFATPEEAGEEVRRRHRPGSAVSVFYDPADPSSAVLEPGVGFLSYVGAILGLSLLALGAGVLWR